MPNDGKVVFPTEPQNLWERNSEVESCGWERVRESNSFFYQNTASGSEREKMMNPAVLPAGGGSGTIAGGKEKPFVDKKKK